VTLASATRVRVLEGIRGEHPARGGPGLVDADQDSAALDQSRSQGTRDGVAAAGDAELAVDALEMGVDGVGGDEELIGDLLALQPVGEQLDDVELAVGQGLDEWRFDRGQGIGAVVESSGLLESGRHGRKELNRSAMV